MKHWLNKALEKMQVYTKTDLRYVMHGGFWTVINYGTQIGIGIITTIALANILPKETLGMYQFVLATAGIIGVFTLTGLGTAISRAVAQGHEGVLRSGVRTKLKWSFGVIAVAFAVAGYYQYNGNTDLAIAFIVVGICTAITESFILYEGYLTGKKAFKDTVTLGLWRKPLPAVALLITLYFTTHVPTLIGAYLGATMISTLLVYVAVIKKYQPPRDDHPETVAYGKQLSIMRLFNQLAAHADKVLLWYILGPTAVASFSIAQLATRYSGGLAGIVSHISLPKFVQRDLSTLQATLPRKVGLFTLAIVPFMVAYMLTVPFIFNFLFSQYPESIPLAQGLGLLFLLIPCSVFRQTLIAHKQTRALYLLSTIIPITKLVFMSLAIITFGVWGAVWALIFNGALETIVGWYFFKTACPDIPTAAAR